MAPSDPRRHRPRGAGRTLRFVTAAAIGLALTIVAAGCADDTDPAATPTAGDLGDPTAAESDTEQVLFVLDAELATIGDPGLDGEREATLIGTDDVLVFTDRPVRDARRTTPALLVQQWSALFDDDPPNAALTGVTADGRSVDVAIEITAASTDGDGTVLTFHGIGDDVDAPLPTVLTGVSLFIDDAGLGCSGPDGATGAEGSDAGCELIYASTFVPFDSSF